MATLVVMGVGTETEIELIAAAPRDPAPVLVGRRGLPWRGLGALVVCVAVVAGVLLSTGAELSPSTRPDDPRGNVGGRGDGLAIFSAISTDEAARTRDVLTWRAGDGATIAEWMDEAGLGAATRTRVVLTDTLFAVVVQLPEVDGVADVCIVQGSLGPGALVEGGLGGAVDEPRVASSMTRVCSAPASIVDGSLVLYARCPGARCGGSRGAFAALVPDNVTALASSADASFNIAADRGVILADIGPADVPGESLVYERTDQQPYPLALDG